MNWTARATVNGTQHNATANGWTFTATANGSAGYFLSGTNADGRIIARRAVSLKAAQSAAARAAKGN